MIPSRTRRIDTARFMRAWTLAGALALAAFAPSRAAADSIDLSWTAPGDDGNTGRASSYELRYATVPVSGADTLGWWANAASAGVLPPPLTAGSREQFTVIGLNTGVTYYFVLRTSDEVPNVSGFSNVRARQTGTGGGPLATPADFTAQVLPGAVRLTWTEPPTGAGNGYHLYRRNAGTTADSLLASLLTAQTSYDDSSAVLGASYEYRLATYDATSEGVPAVAAITVSGGEVSEASTSVRGFPNPARDHATIRVRSKSKDGGPGRVRVVIYDLTGHRICQLFDGVVPSGEQSIDWACRTDKGNAIAPGIYNVIVDAPGGRSVTQLAVVP